LAAARPPAGAALLAMVYRVMHGMMHRVVYRVMHGVMGPMVDGVMYRVVDRMMHRVVGLRKRRRADSKTSKYHGDLHNQSFL